MIQEINIADVRKNLGELLNEVRYRRDSILIKKAGKPIAALIEIELFEKIKSLQTQFAHLTMDLNKAYQNESAESVESDIKEALDSISG